MLEPLLLAGGAAASGIASIWARDPMAAALGAMGLAEAHDGRFLLGLGVSHAPSATRRGHVYEKPVAKMASYLDEMATVSSPIAGPEPAVPVVLAALGPRMLRLAAERTSGAHPYFVPVEHTAFARRTVGEGPFIAPEQAVILETDPERAREVAREHTGIYLALDNYRRNLLRLGWSESDLADGGSDALVDAVVAWGQPQAVAGRVRAHLEAGADHVSIQVLPRGDRFPLAALEILASELV